MKRLILSFLARAALLGFIAGGWLYGLSMVALNSPVNLSASDDQSVLWDVPAGGRLGDINRQLHAKGIIRYPQLISLYAILFQKTTVIAGEYSIETSDTPKTLLQKFNRGEVMQHSITFPEGWSFQMWISHLSQIAQFEKDIAMGPVELLRRAGVTQVNPEGWLFPDTYSYTSASSVVDIIKQAYLKMQSTLSQEWALRAVGLPYNSQYDALIMASIIEKETGLVSEMPVIAGVFVRRLALGMRLQTDPSVIYGMADRYHGNITRADLRRPTAYNTYTIDGLPPTPIAMPSANAIRAALHPEQGSSLYFVARGDGGHYFSSTLEEHNEAVQRYQIRQRNKNYQSSPK
ncbi:MAG: endolytic transglycosylase MltG [Porticoccaceae bacterium]|nr:endolytic transglycosylase MltG [Porticoccaceae bacterium]MDG1475324.1 endolytic transglycosylase MltG [Porticoccaceae bacterium]